jgi:hypothetical protein
MSYSGKKLALAPERGADIAVIKEKMSAKSDSAAMNEAIRCWAPFAGRDISKIEMALLLYDKLTSEMRQGAVLFAEKPGDGNYSKKELWLPI